MGSFVRSGRQDVGWIQAERGASLARASLSSETLRDRCQARGRVQRGVGFAVRAWTTGAEVVGTREPGAGGYAPAALGLQCLTDHREPLVVPSIVGPDWRRAGDYQQGLHELLPLADRLGVRILAGTDTAGTIAREVALLAEHGLNPAAALAAATTTGYHLPTTMPRHVDGAQSPAAGWSQLPCTPCNLHAARPT